MEKLISKIVVFLFSLGFTTTIVAKNINDEAIKNQLSLLSFKYNLPGVVMFYKFGNQPIKTVFVGNASIYPIKPMSENTFFPSREYYKIFYGYINIKIS